MLAIVALEVAPFVDVDTDVCILRGFLFVLLLSEQCLF